MLFPYGLFKHWQGYLSFPPLPLWFLPSPPSYAPAANCFFITSVPYYLPT